MSNSFRAFVRSYDASRDLDNVVNVFRETCDEGLEIEPIWTIGSYLWCRPYLALSPETCFVVDDGQGHAVGYTLGVANTECFINRWVKDYIPTIEQDLRKLPLSPSAKASGLEGLHAALLSALYDDPSHGAYGDFATQLADWPGHLHIDILPSHQRQGLGRKLIGTLLDPLKARECSGVYLGMSAVNRTASSFYESCGFKRLPHVLDQGVSGEEGRFKAPGDSDGVMYYVKTC